MKDAKVKVKSVAKEKSAYGEIDKLGVYTLGVAAIVIGAWSLTAFVAAASTIGLTGLVSGFFIAIGLV